MPFNPVEVRQPERVIYTKHEATGVDQEPVGGECRHGQLEGTKTAIRVLKGQRAQVGDALS